MLIALFFLNLPIMSLESPLEQLEHPPTLSEQKAKLIPFVALLIALLAIGIGPIFVRFSIAEIGANATTFNRFWIAGVVFGIWNGVLALRQDTPEEALLESKQLYTPKTLVLLLLVGCFFASIQLFWALSLTQTTVASSVTILHGLRPLLTTLGGWILFKKHYDRKFLIGMIIAILGSIFIGYNDFSVSIHKLLGDLLAILSGLCSALELLIMEHLLTQFKTQTLMLWCCVIASLVMISVLAIVNQNFFPVSLQGWAAVIALALLSQVIGHGLIIYSLNYLSSGVVAVSMLLDPVISAIFAWVILREHITILNGILSCIVLFGIYVSLSSNNAVKINRPIAKVSNT
ncbi:DMT family transporter [Cylindrospermopsis raciborskii CS-506_D]|uniref:DMT family transporter n=2 Tax=Cylindrospermopsis raciborskii TaxID=77022 RepID=A0A838WNE6_9CYAN|nr:DMT family transporter [Cylindrospermopsis raciborskii CS-506_C]MBA4451123.1 DMT family transporter [Cylindrospermopsis raciborskii CS-506_D]MBA4457727.1 DMT family transporter [Cylindrospermopsis raciborskii CS-506_B]MBA4467096.1 DMT family transporter [Cylindrospermopsis raciborskii CS-506_A]